MFDGKRFTPDTDILGLLGNNGLGKQSALQLAKHNPTAIYITSRSLEKGLVAIAEIEAAVPGVKLHLLQLDLASLESVQNAAKEFSASSPHLDILINNAGIMAVPTDVTEDGYEIQFGTNHLGHALLSKLLLPMLLETAETPGADVRIVTLTSLSHSWTPKGGIKFETLRTPQLEESNVAKYGQSKLANILHSQELARRYPSITCVSVHPGMVETGLSKPMRRKHLWVRMFEATIGSLIGVSVEQGVLNQLWAATSKDVVSGGYYVPVGNKADGSTDARNEQLARRLWDWTSKELEGYII
ncbi:hypothetical protein VE04_04154 [Pseudogymnoascus sp. 24MN13]|nr:hypothetical protein VE04_04154 [Pseudogymnoascus sp. 24MN13]